MRDTDLILNEIKQQNPFATSQYVVGLVAWHNADNEPGIERTKREITSGWWDFTSSDIDVTQDLWTLNLVLPAQRTNDKAILIEIIEPYDPMLPNRVVGVHIRAVPAQRPPMHDEAVVQIQ